MLSAKHFSHDPSSVQWGVEISVCCCYQSEDRALFLAEQVAELLPSCLERLVALIVTTVVVTGDGCICYISLWWYSLAGI